MDRPKNPGLCRAVAAPGDLGGFAGLALAHLALPVLVLVLLHLDAAYVTLLVVNVLVALAGLELSWWSVRLRHRLLVPFGRRNGSAATVAPTGTDEEDREEASGPLPHSPLTPPPPPLVPPSPTVQISPTTAAALVPGTATASTSTPVCAISSIARRWFGGHRLVATAVVSVVITGAILGILIAVDSSIMSPSKSSLGQWMLFMSAGVGAFVAAIGACLAPTPADGVVVFVYETCFVVSSLNSFLAQHEHLISDPELLDALYVTLVGACALVVWRIVSSHDVLESLLMVMTDIFGLAYVVAPLMALADFLGHPSIAKYDHLVAMFIVVTCAAEGAFRLHQLAQCQFPTWLRGGRQSIVGKVAPALSWTSLVLSLGVAVLAGVATAFAYPGYRLQVVDGLVFVGAVLMSQGCRGAIEAFQGLVVLGPMDPSPARTSWVPGVLEFVNPYLLATIVFHPFIKSVLKT